MEMSDMKKFLILLWLLFRRPTWALQLIWQSSYNPANSRKHHFKRLQEYKQYELSLDEAVQRITNTSLAQANSIINEYKWPEVGGGLDNSVIPEKFNASLELAQLCYSLVRLTKPSIVVETGVGRGITSCYILKALEKNRTGRLYSIDLPVLEFGAKKDVGKMVPPSLRSRWKLIFGPGTLEMKKLYGELKSIDIFVHDSEHSYLNQLAEYKIALAWLKKGGILVSDNVGNDALLETCKRIEGKLMVTKQAKSKYLGVIIK
jgi:predicted O-methyltransferase YrrM